MDAQQHPVDARPPAPRCRRRRVAAAALLGWYTIGPGTMVAGAVDLPASATTQCAHLARSAAAPLFIESAIALPAGPVPLESASGDQAKALELAAHCRIAGVIRPTPESTIRFQLWLPSANWNGRLEGVGNGNYGGMLAVDALAYGVQRGSAIFATDTGHESTPPDPRTGDWGRSDERIVDFGHRAVHETVRASKQLVREYFGRPAAKSYFVSCSNGGRQGLMSAQRYPEDFDGIVAGAPVRSWTRLNSHFMSFLQRFRSDPATRLSPLNVEALRTAVLDKCDRKDGVADGIVDDPRQCGFDDTSLLCSRNNVPGCLSDRQLETVRLLRRGTAVPQSAMVPGLPAGTESDAWGTWIFGSTDRRSGFEYLSVPFFRDLLYRDPQWTPEKFNVLRDSVAAQRNLSPVLDAVDPDLGKFFARGGKLILYTGWLDPAIPALDTIEYRDEVRSAVGPARADASLRLFVVPGMAHCGDGPGFSSFGQWYNGTNRPTEDVRAALVDWVERDRPPERIVATRQGESLWTDPRATTEDASALPARPICAYPARARWIGKGSIDDPRNFECVAPTDE